jgi:hypothetical protein
MFNHTYFVIEAMKKMIAGFGLLIFIIGNGAASDVSPGDAKAIYETAAENAASEYRHAHAKCDELQGNAQDVCIAEAKAIQTRTKGQAEAQYKNTAKARIKARTDLANAEFIVASTRCEIKIVKDKDNCIKEAKAVKAAALVEAKMDRKMPEGQAIAAIESQDTAMKVSNDKCSLLSGGGKEKCLAPIDGK